MKRADLPRAGHLVEILEEARTSLPRTTKSVRGHPSLSMAFAMSLPGGYMDEKLKIDLEAAILDAHRRYEARCEAELSALGVEVDS